MEWKRRMKATGDGSNKRNILRPYKLFIRGQFSIWCFPYLFSFSFGSLWLDCFDDFFLRLDICCCCSLSLYFYIVSWKALLNDVQNSKIVLLFVSLCSHTSISEKEIWFKRLQWKIDRLLVHYKIINLHRLCVFVSRNEYISLEMAQTKIWPFSFFFR